MMNCDFGSPFILFSRRIWELASGTAGLPVPRHVLGRFFLYYLLTREVITPGLAYIPRLYGRRGCLRGALALAHDCFYSRRRVISAPVVERAWNERSKSEYDAYVYDVTMNPHKLAVKKQKFGQLAVVTY